MMFLVIEELNEKDFERVINEELKNGSKIISTGLSPFRQTNHYEWGSQEETVFVYWAHVLRFDNQHIGEYPYPPTRTLE